MCDNLKRDLEPFKHRLTLETVNILEKENVKFLRLYRYDIPVLMLNGQLLCMHRLNTDLLEQRLTEIEEENKSLENS